MFNGEIYNYLELKEGLEARGHSFRGGSDTEVLLEHLRRTGSGGLLQLNGMFAVAFINEQSNTFILARDRLGVKPLYVCRQPGRLWFASEAKALLAAGAAERRVDEAALTTYFGLGYVTGRQSIFAGVERLEPGGLVEGYLHRPEAAIETTWWTSPWWSEEAGAGAEGTSLEELETVLADATKVRLRSDVPVGVFLSGGIDSGLTAAFAERGRGGADLSAITVRWQEKSHDESELAGLTARALGLKHIIVPVRPVAARLVDRLSWYFDEPFSDASALPTFALCEAARSQGTVFLGGDGGDEAFGGYGRYVAVLRHRWLSGVPKWASGIAGRAARFLPPLSRAGYRLQKVGLEEGGYAAAWDGVPNDPALRVALGDDRIEWLRHSGDRLWTEWRRSSKMNILRRMQATDYAVYLPDDILVKVDRASMANSIEVRSPFLDHRVVELAARMAWESLADSREGKKPLRALARKLLPAPVAIGRKKGFGVPLEAWFRDRATLDWLGARLLSGEAIRRGLWDGRGVSRLLAHQRRGRGRDLSVLLWRLLILDAWARWYLDSNAPLGGAPT